MSETKVLGPGLTDDEIHAIADFEDDLLDAIERIAATDVPVYEVIFAATKLFSRMAFDMAPSPDVAQETLKVGVDEARKGWEEDLNLEYQVIRPKEH